MLIYEVGIRVVIYTVNHWGLSARVYIFFRRCELMHLRPLCGLVFIILSWILIHQRLGRKESGFVHSNVHIGEPNHFFQGFGLAIDIELTKTF